MKNMYPDFENRLRKVLLCQGAPDRIPLIEGGIYSEIKEKFLGRPIESLEDEADFWEKAGHDAIVIRSGIREITDAAIPQQNQSRFQSKAPDTQPVQIAKDFAIDKLKTQKLSSQTGSGTRHWASSKEGIIVNDDDFNNFPWPEPNDLDYSIFEEASRILMKEMKIIPFTGQILSPVYLMMGFENFYLKLALDDPLIEKMFQKIGEFSLKTVEILLEFDCIGAIWINDDMAGATNTLINPDDYRRLNFPWYERIAKLVHAKNLPLILHSDGCIYSILDDLIRIGFDAIHPIEPKAMDIGRVREIVGPDICLIGNVDVDFPLSRGNPDDVSKAVRNLIRTMGPDGGYCISSSNSIPDYVPYDNWLAMRNAAIEYGEYPIRV